MIRVGHAPFVEGGSEGKSGELGALRETGKEGEGEGERGRGGGREEELACSKETIQTLIGLRTRLRCVL